MEIELREVRVPQWPDGRPMTCAEILKIVDSPPRRQAAASLTCSLRRDLALVVRDLCRFMDDGLMDLNPLPDRQFDRLFGEVLRAKWALEKIEAITGKEAA
jgi:hypothetical protein